MSRLFWMRWTALGSLLLLGRAIHGRRQDKEQQQEQETSDSVTGVDRIDQHIVHMDGSIDEKQEALYSKEQQPLFLEDDQTNKGAMSSSSSLGVADPPCEFYLSTNHSWLIAGQDMPLANEVVFWDSWSHHHHDLVIPFEPHTNRAWPRWGRHHYLW